jgi:hypothetical protein
MQNGHRGALPGHILVGAIIGEGARQNKGKTSSRRTLGTEGFEQLRRERIEWQRRLFVVGGSSRM